ncbi:MAG: hypothetical protein V1799_04125 [bacterium]
MKRNIYIHSILLLLLLPLANTSVEAQTQTQSKFIIGVDWITKPPREPYTNIIPTQAEWNMLASLGVNCGMIALPERVNIQDYYNSVTTALGNSPVDLIIFGYRFSRFTDGHRWVYHPEYDQHYPNFTGRIGSSVIDQIQTPPAKKDADVELDGSAPNAWETVGGLAGFIAKNLLLSSEQPDSIKYYLKVRMRLNPGTSFNHTPVLVIQAVRADTTMVDTVFADEFNDYNYREIPSLSFRKMPVGKSLGPYESINEIEVSHIPPRDLIGYATGRPDEVISAVSNTAYDYQLYWPGLVSCYVDYLAIDDSTSNSLFIGTNDIAIREEVNLFQSNPKLSRFKINDEPTPPHWPLVGYVDNIIRSWLTAENSEKRGFHYNIGYDENVGIPDRMVKRNIVITNNLQNTADIYPFKADPSKSPLPDQPGYTSTIQNWIQTYLIDKLAINIKHSKALNRNFWYQAQAHSWKNFENGIWNGDQREPTVQEINLQANLAIAYGAKGIQYFLYRSYESQADRISGIGMTNLDGTKRETNPYGDNKWEGVKALNQKLAIQGPTLLNLTWLGTKSWHNNSTTENWPYYVNNVTTNISGETKYVETGHFTAGGDPYLFVVNRRTLSTESRIVTVSLGNTESKKVTDLLSGNNSIIPINGSFVATLDPGEGRLYKIELALPAAPTLISPVNGATNVSTAPTLSWNASPGATSYRIQLSTNSTFSSTPFDQSGLTSTSFAVPGLVTNTTYYWRVNATNSIGTGEWSPYRSFTTGSNVDQNTVWSGSISIIMDATVNSGITLMVNPGTNIAFSSNASLSVNGNLTAQGTSNQHITIDGGNSGAGINDYEGAVICFLNGGTGNIQYTDISHAARGIYGNNAGNISVSNCTFTSLATSPWSYGVQIYNSASSTITINGNTFTGYGSDASNKSFGITIANLNGTTSNNVTLQQNSIQNSYEGYRVQRANAIIQGGCSNSCSYGATVIGSSPSISGVSFQSNTKGIYLSKSDDGTPSGGTIQSCQITQFAEQGIYCDQISTPLYRIIQSLSLKTRTYHREYISAAGVPM